MSLLPMTEEEMQASKNIGSQTKFAGPSGSTPNPAYIRKGKGFINMPALQRLRSFQVNRDGTASMPQPGANPDQPPVARIDNFSGPAATNVIKTAAPEVTPAVTSAPSSETDAFSAPSAPESVGYDAVTANASGYTGATANAKGYTGATASSTGYNPFTAKTSTYNPTMRDVDRKDTVAGQITDITSSDSPYMQRARTKAMQFGNRRGLINSSITARAGEAAAIDAALPIAQQDAQTYLTQGIRNQEFTNEAGRFNAGEENRMSMFNADAENEAGRFTADAENKVSMYNADSENEANRFTADAENKVSMYNADSENEANRFTADANNKTSMFNAEAGNRAREFGATAENTASRDKFALDSDLSRMDRDAQHRLELEREQMANQRAIAGKEQENLAFSQYLKGVADINAQDISITSKQEATKILWDEYSKNSQIGAALSNATIKDGQVVWAENTGGSDTSSGSETGTGGDSTSSTGTGNTQTPAPPKQSLDYFDYQSADQMPEFMQAQYTQRYGDVPPPDVKKIEGVIAYANDKFEQYLDSSSIYSAYGTRINGRYRYQYADFVDSELKKLDINYDKNQIYKAITGKDRPKDKLDWNI